MLERSVRIAAVVIAVCMVSAAESVAQEQVLNLLNNGKPPSAPIPVSVVDGGQRRALTTTDAGGTARFDPGLLNLGKGTRIDVYVTRCVDGRIQVILVPSGEQDPCAEEEARAGEDCGCEHVGAFVLGDGPVWIDVGTGEVSTGGPPSQAPRITIGVKADAAFWPKLEDVCREGAGSCDAASASAQIAGFVEAALIRLQSLSLGLGVGGTYSKPSLRLGEVEGDLEVLTLDLYGRASWWMGPVGLYGQLGTAYVTNEAEFDSADSIGEEERTNTGWKFLGGAGIDWRALSSVGLRLNLTYVSGGSGDADTQVRVGLGGVLFVGR